MINRVSFFCLIRKGLMILAGLLFSFTSRAHPMPNSLLLLDIKSNYVTAELQLPLGEFQLAFGGNLVTGSETLVQRLGPQLQTYILAHIHPVSNDGGAWKVQVQNMHVSKAEQNYTGIYKELIVTLLLLPPAGANSRNFILNYDVIIHQVVTHKAIVAVRQDWENGLHGDTTTEVGIISLDVKNNLIHPLVINQQPGSAWRGFKSMVTLGMRHIGEGTDHLLFLLTLLLPATLLVSNKRWNGFGGTRYSITKLVKIVTAFTIGHSVTLLAGAVGWLHLPGRPVEILIAFSILVSAIHAIRPIFPGREMYIAAGFGLVHGLAFASVLTSLQLEGTKLALSILGFNIGIELMQLFVMAVTLPWLIVLSCSKLYKWVRITGAIFAAIAAIAWMLERIFLKPNPITELVQKLANYAPWIILVLACMAIINFLQQRNKKNPVVKA